MRPPLVARTALALAVLAAAALAASCATAPAPGPAQRASDLPRLVCGQGSRLVDLRLTGVPGDRQLLDVALDEDRVWVLAEPRFLVELSREAGGSARFLSGRDDTPPWAALAADPAGGLWIVSRTSFDLLHFDPATGRTRRVTVERASGPGGFSDVAVGDGVVYVTPTCSDHGVWSVDPDGGRLLDRSFPVAEQAGPGVAEPTGCSIASLASGPGGSVYASWGGRVYRPAADGWSEAPELAASGVPTGLRGIDVGRRTETWFFENTIGFVFVAGEPVWVGGPALSVARDRQGQILFRRGDRELVPHLEPCLGQHVRAFDSDDTGYAFLTSGVLVLGPEGAPAAADAP